MLKWTAIVLKKKGRESPTTQKKKQQKSNSCILEKLKAGNYNRIE
jgi:hypothetical protein